MSMIEPNPPHPPASRVPPSPLAMHQPADPLTFEHFCDASVQGLVQRLVQSALD